jgi:SIR2-like domain
MVSDLEHVKAIQKALRQEKLVIIAGAGVTLNATNSPSNITWKGLILDGLDYLENENFLKPDDDDLDYFRRVLRKPDMNPNNFLRACSFLKEELDKHIKFPTWLNSVFGSLHEKVTDPDVYEVLYEFYQRDARLMTTNYDQLIEKHCGGDLERVRYSVPHNASKFRAGSLKGVFHIHGSFQDPEDVVFDPEGYKQVKASDEVMGLLKGYLQHSTILFIGCGTGLEDPNFDALLKQATREAQNLPNRHYLLVRNDDNINYSPLINLRYGSDYKELGPYLRKLLEKDPTMSSIERTKEHLKESKKQIVSDNIYTRHIMVLLTYPHKNNFRGLIPKNNKYKSASTTEATTSKASTQPPAKESAQEAGGPAIPFPQVAPQAPVQQPAQQVGAQSPAKALSRAVPQAPGKQRTQETGTAQAQFKTPSQLPQQPAGGVSGADSVDTAEAANIGSVAKADEAVDIAKAVNTTKTAKVVDTAKASNNDSAVNTPRSESDPDSERNLDSTRASQHQDSAHGDPESPLSRQPLQEPPDTQQPGPEETHRNAAEDGSEHEKLVLTSHIASKAFPLS